MKRVISKKIKKKRRLVVEFKKKVRSLNKSKKKKKKQKDKKNLLYGNITKSINNKMNRHLFVIIAINNIRVLLQLVH